jgi:hypothetical protein
MTDEYILQELDKSIYIRKMRPSTANTAKMPGITSTLLMSVLLFEKINPVLIVITVLNVGGFDNNGFVKTRCGTVALYGPVGFFLRYGRLSMNNLG